jgi:hypothetical protein
VLLASVSVTRQHVIFTPTTLRQDSLAENGQTESADNYLACLRQVITSTARTLTAEIVLSESR